MRHTVELEQLDTEICSYDACRMKSLSESDVLQWLSTDDVQKYTYIHPRFSRTDILNRNGAT